MLTAKYGLVEAHTEIEPHSVRWPKDMDETLADKVSDQLIDVLGELRSDTLIILSDAQQLYLEGVPALRRGPSVRYAMGKLKERQAQLEYWILK